MTVPTIQDKKMQMLEMSKLILQKVSFDKQLFTKELRKAVRWLQPDEKMILKVWCLTTFGEIYRDTIIDVFRNFTKT